MQVQIVSSNLVTGMGKAVVVLILLILLSMMKLMVVFREVVCELREVCRSMVVFQPHKNVSRTASD